MEFWPRKKLSPEQAAMPAGIPVEPVQERSRTPEHELRSVSSPETFLKAMDFDALNDIFDVMQARSGTETDAYRFRVSEEAIRIYRGASDLMSREDSWAERVSPKHAGEANAHLNLIILNWDFIQDEKNPGLRAAHLLVHETTHLRSRREYQIDLPMTSRKTSGVSERGIDGDKSNVFHIAHSLNEAITEDVALGVLKEYLRRTGNGRFLEGEEAQLESLVSYGSDRVLFHVLVDALAESLGVDRDVVYQGFVQTYLNGSGKIRTLFEALEEAVPGLPPGVADELLSGKNADATIGVSAIRERIGKETSYYKAAMVAMSALDPDTVHDALGLR